MKTKSIQYNKREIYIIKMIDEISCQWNDVN